MNQLRNALQPESIDVIESCELFAVYVQDAGYVAAFVEYWDNDFAVGQTAASDMSGKLMYVGHYYCAGFVPTGAAYATSFADSGTGHRPLERTQYQLLSNHPVETGPPETETFMDKCGHVGHARNLVILILNEGLDFIQQFFVCCTFAHACKVIQFPLNKAMTCRKNGQSEHLS